MAKGPVLSIQQTTDKLLQENLVKLQEYLRLNAVLENFKHYEIIFTSAQTNFRYRHGLALIPKDIIVTRFVGDGDLTFNYDEFTKDEFDITTTGACEIRFFAGVNSG